MDFRFKDEQLKREQVLQGAAVQCWSGSSSPCSRVPRGFWRAPISGTAPPHIWHGDRELLAPCHSPKNTINVIPFHTLQLVTWCSARSFTRNLRNHGTRSASSSSSKPSRQPKLTCLHSAWSLVCFLDPFGMEEATSSVASRREEAEMDEGRVRVKRV